MPPPGNTILLKHVKENLPIHLNDPEFSQQFAYGPGDEATPSTSKPNLNFPSTEVICKWAEAAKHFLEEEGGLDGGQTSFPCPSVEGLPTLKLIGSLLIWGLQGSYWSIK